MDTIQEFFNNIGRSDVNKNSKHLLSSGTIDSMDVISLVSEIEKYYNKSIKSDFVKPEAFEDFESIQYMIREGINRDSSF
ncbi:acyl carrier protein [Campylobacter lari]|uniref:acyl carrier protein n=1 Tax=Campylobacter lari TaxID=201 RepID=UPI0021E659DE|nr:acyl carrier protein [Campylobacter lari]MCV3384662.1 acyl carrier protein [Campylobacter lari]MCW0223896.1 acyl carrier protein [Campylobacter lari]MCW0256643.1 acyl carrier protein [Campylobacter lari]HEC1788295.1 acyl carrier protein [Campylobacter lari]